MEIVRPKGMIANGVFALDLYLGLKVELLNAVERLVEEILELSPNTVLVK